MEITGGKNPVTYRAVKMYKLIRPEYKLQEKTESFASSSSAALPISSVHGPETLGRNPLTSILETLGPEILGPLIDLDSMSPSNSSKSGTSFQLKGHSSKINAFMSILLKVSPIENMKVVSMEFVSRGLSLVTVEIGKISLCERFYCSCQINGFISRVVYILLESRICV
jgi:hypothetical protein